MNIAIRGAGKYGKYIQQQIENNKNYEVRYFVDSNENLQGQRINDIPTITQEELEKKLGNEVDLVLVAINNSIEQFSHIVSKKGKYGFIKNRVFEAGLTLSDDLLSDKDIVWSDAEYLDKPVLRSLETNIVDHCNLNCRGCSHFSNLFQCGDQVPFDIYCKDMTQVSQKVFINQFNMLGGEALLNDKIIEYIEFTRKILPYTDIQLITNGLLIPKQSEDFFECCRKNDITISISGYKPTLMIKDKIKEVLDRYHIVYIFREDVIEFGKNIDLSGSADKYEAVKRCRENRCHFLRYGKIYKCPFEVLGNVLFNHYGIDICFDGGSNIYDDDLDWNEMIHKLYYEPIEACKYCGQEEKIEWKVQNNPVLGDWVV